MLLNRSKISATLAEELGLPADIIEKALKKALKQNGYNTLDNLSLSSPTNVHNNIQDSEPVDELSRRTALDSPDSNHDFHPSLLDNDSETHKAQQEPSTQSFKKDRKDSLSSVIEITQSGSTSINIKLPSLYASTQTVQGEILNGQNNSQSLAGTNTKSSDVNANSVYGNRSESILYSDEQNIHNLSNKGLMQNQQSEPVLNIFDEHIQPQVQNTESFMQSQQNESDISKEYIQPQQKEPDVRVNQVQNTAQNTYESFMYEPQKIDDVSKEYIQPQRRDSLDQTYDAHKPFGTDVTNQRQQGEFLAEDSHKSFFRSSKAYTFHSQADNQHPKTDFIKNKPTETYHAEWPSLSEAAKKNDSRKNSELDLGGWGQMDLNIASAWGKPKKWSPETESITPEPPVATWNPNDVNQLTWEPIQEQKTIFFRKKKPTPVNFELDDTEGWGKPPAKPIPWDDSRQGYCIDLIEEQRETTFWSRQNGVWVNVSEESKITQEKRVVERTSDGVNRKNIRQNRTQRFGIDNLDNATWSEVHEQTKRERLGNGLIGSENISVNLMDDDIGSNNSSKAEDSQSNSAKCTTAGSVEGLRERLGNPKWKTEKEWRAHNSLLSKRDLGTQDTSSSKSSDDEPLTTSDRDENVSPFGLNEETSNLDEGFDSYSFKNISAEIKYDAWFIEDAKEQEDMIKEPEKNLLLINVDSNSDNAATESTIINTHPPIFHGTINNEMSNSNDFMLDYVNSANMSNTGVTNNSELISFDDEYSEVPTSSNDTISQPQENNHSFNVEEFEIFLENRTNNLEVDNIGVSENSNEVQPVLPYTIKLDDNESSHYTTSSNSAIDQSKSQTKIESITPSSILDAIANDSENKRPVKDPNSARDTTKGREYIADIIIETQSYGKQHLRIYYGDDVQKVVTDFCERWDMLDLEESLKGLVQRALRKKLRRKKKSKNSSKNQL